MNLAFRGRRLVAVVAALAWLDLVLIQPNHPQALGWQALLLVPLELPAILLALFSLGPGRAGQLLRVVLVPALTVIAVLKVADFAMFTALGRGFNPSLTCRWSMPACGWWPERSGHLPESPRR